MALKNDLIGLIKRLVSPRAQDPDDARRETILNILLMAIIALLSSGIMIFISRWHLSGIDNPQAYAVNTLPVVVLLVILSFFIVLYLLSRKGLFRVSSYIFILILLVLAAYMGNKWGTDVNVAILFYILAIVMSSILVSTRFSFVMTLFAILSFLEISDCQSAGICSPSRYWRTEGVSMASSAMIAIFFAVIAAVSWLSNREIEKSLARARRSEAELKKERDSLEVKVEKRTKELTEMQAERMVQVYRFAELGRLSSGFFHDLINPLSAVALNMDKVRTQGGDAGSVNETKMYLDSAVSATKKMEDMVTAVRKQMSKQSNDRLFSLSDEIKEVIDILAYKAKKAGIDIVFSGNGEIQTVGDAMKFNQVILNLVGNAIDAYLPSSVSGEGRLQKVIVDLRQEGDEIVLRVEDYGIGIPEENLDKIFEPFFTTKGESGMGIGLPMVKRIVETDFNGTIALKSARGEGTTFIITLKSRPHGNNI